MVLRRVFLFTLSIALAFATIPIAFAESLSEEVGSLGQAAASGFGKASAMANIYSAAYSQQGQTTDVNVQVDPTLITGGYADSVAIEATMNYGGLITRDIKASQNLTELTPDGNGDYTFAVDFTTYGKFSVTASFYKGTSLKGSSLQTVGVVADTYNIASLSGTLPVSIFTLELWGKDVWNGNKIQSLDTATKGIRQDASGNAIPTILLAERPASLDWSKLPEGVYAMPYLTEQEIQTQPSSARDASDKFRQHLAALKSYVHDLYALNTEATFHLFLADYYLGQIQSVIYANQIPEGQYSLTVLSDGTFSASKFASVYTGSTVGINQAMDNLLAEKWKAAKAEAYKNGTVSSGFTDWTDDYINAVLQCEDNIQWWLGRKDLLVSQSDGNAFGALAQTNSKIVQVALASKLSTLQAIGTDATAEFKALYNFNDDYFAAAKAAGKNVMLFIGSRVTSENGTFAPYARLTELICGDTYKYYYKGHPATPTAFYPSKQAELADLGITDVDSTIPAELIIFFNPGIYLSGYNSSTFISVSNSDQKKVLFGLTKAAAASNTNNIKDMSYFVSPVGTDSPAALQTLSGQGKGTYMVEFSDAILAGADYTVALWNNDTGKLSYYKQNTDGTYTFVRQQQMLPDKGYTLVTGNDSARASYTVTNSAKHYVSYKTCKTSTSAKTATVPNYIMINSTKYHVTGISSAAFKYRKKIRTVIVKARYLTKDGVRQCLQSSGVTLVKFKYIPTATVRNYKIWFAKKSIVGKSVSIALA